MGEMADWFVNQMLDYGYDEYYSRGRPRRRTYQSGSGNYMWRNGDGETISMYKMSNEHLLNAIEVCKKRGNTGKQEQLEEVLRERMNGQNPNR